MPQQCNNAATHTKMPSAECMTSQPPSAEDETTPPQPQDPSPDNQDNQDNTSVGVEVETQHVVDQGALVVVVQSQHEEKKGDSSLKTPFCASAKPVLIILTRI